MRMMGTEDASTRQALKNGVVAADGSRVVQKRGKELVGP
jgi:hypothetical protein